MKTSWKAFSASAFHGHLIIPLKEASIALVSSMSHAFLVDIVVGEIIELVVISVHSCFSCYLSRDEIGCNARSFLQVFGSASALFDPLPSQPFPVSSATVLVAQCASCPT